MAVGSCEHSELSGFPVLKRLLFLRHEDVDSVLLALAACVIESNVNADLVFHTSFLVTQSKEETLILTLVRVETEQEVLSVD